jgi:hypothetical protein
MRARTMIYLEKEQHRALRAEAAREGVSVAELLRRVVRKYLEDRPGGPRVPRGVSMKLVGLGASGRSVIAERHDAYLAGALRRATEPGAAGFHYRDRRQIFE